MTSSDQPTATPRMIAAAQAAREDAYHWNMDQYLSGKRPLNLCVLELRKAYREAERTLRGFRV